MLMMNPVLALDHGWNNQPNQPQSRLDVNVHHLIQHLIGYGQSRALSDVSGAVIDEDINGADARGGLLHEFLDGLAAPVLER